MRFFSSFILFFVTSIARYTDHIYRTLIGLPQMARSEITPQLYLGGQYSKRGYKKMQDIGITAIVNMRETPAPIYQDLPSLHILHLPTKDMNQPTIQDLLKGIQFIQKELDHGGKVYIHCRLGEGRGPTMMIAYLMSRGMTPEDALKLVKDVRPFVRPTAVQIAQLSKLNDIITEGSLSS